MNDQAFTCKRCGRVDVPSLRDRETGGICKSCNELERVLRRVLEEGRIVERLGGR